MIWDNKSEGCISMKNGYIRVAAATPKVKVADCKFNSEEIIENIKEAEKHEAVIVVFPELSITAYSCGELFRQRTLLNEARVSLKRIADQTKTIDIISIVGLPLMYNSSLMNCAAVIYHGEVLGIVPKSYIPSYSEFSEGRFFKSALDIKNGDILLDGRNIPFGTNLIFSCIDLPEFKFAVEICEDLCAPNSPSVNYSLAGATIICNLAASNEQVSKAGFMRSLVSMQSAKLVAAYVYANAGQGESTQDVVYGGQNIICEKGAVLEEAERFKQGIIYADVDVDLLCSERQRLTTFNVGKRPEMREVFFNYKLKDYSHLMRAIEAHPFVPNDIEKRNIRCEEVLNIQAEGLCKRLVHTGIKVVILGLSGGLDSTLALLVTVKAFDKLGLSRDGIVAVTMPAFGTTERTYNNSVNLARALGVELRDINIKDAVIQHFKDIGHDISNHDITYENSQARERTQVLMDLSNSLNGLVVGTGDLSELALGWATYNGDHMSMYGVNCSVPKTLIRHLITYVADESEDSLKKTLKDIVNTPVSPELLPPVNGVISQITEDTVGPYELHDFFLYYIVRYGFEPNKIFRIAKIAFTDTYEPTVILKWLKVFYRRFFSQQFKRSCLPDGPKVGSVCLSPRGDFKMPSDASAKIWLDELESLGESL